MSHLLIICAKRYNGHELWTLLGILQNREHTFEVVSQEIIIRDEKSLRPNTTERTVYEVMLGTVNNFDAVCVVSGNMADTEAYWNDEWVGKLLVAFREQDKVCAAICCSVPTLGPIVKDVKVSYFPLVRSRHHLQFYGALLQNVSLMVDGRIITAENQMITTMWAEEICNVLEGRPLEHVLYDTGFMPKGMERKMMPVVRAAIDESRGYKMVMRKGENNDD